MALIMVALAAAPAYACQLVCMQTTTRYDGNLGGLAGADAKCAAEYTGFKFARTTSVIMNLADTAPSAALNAWAGTYTSSGADANNCLSWTSGSAGNTGGFVRNTVYSTGTENLAVTAASALTCDSQRPLLCCNM